MASRSKVRNVQDVVNVIKLVKAVQMINLVNKKAKKTKRACWVRPWIARRDLPGRSTLSLVHSELATEDPLAFKNYLRMNQPTFSKLLELVDPIIKKQDTFMRRSISSQYRLSLTLRFLATGASYIDLQYATRIPACTISLIVPEVCRAIYDVLKQEHLKVMFQFILYHNTGLLKTLAEEQLESCTTVGLCHIFARHYISCTKAYVRNLNQLYSKITKILDYVYLLLNLTCAFLFRLSTVNENKVFVNYFLHNSFYMIKQMADFEHTC